MSTALYISHPLNKTNFQIEALTITLLMIYEADKLMIEITIDHRLGPEKGEIKSQIVGA